MPAAAVHNGTGPQPVQGHRQNFMKALRASWRPPVASEGWLGLSGGHGRRSAPRNRSGARRNRVARPRPCPQRPCTVEQGRDLCRGIVRILRKLFKRPGGRRWPPECGSASLEASTSVVPYGIGAMPDGIGPRSALPAHARARSGWARWTGPRPVWGHR